MRARTGRAVRAPGRRLEFQVRDESLVQRVVEEHTCIGVLRPHHAARHRMLAWQREGDILAGCNLPVGGLHLAALDGEIEHRHLAGAVADHGLGTRSTTARSAARSSPAGPVLPPPGESLHMSKVPPIAEALIPEQQPAPRRKHYARRTARRSGTALDRSVLMQDKAACDISHLGDDHDVGSGKPAGVSGNGGRCKLANRDCGPRRRIIWLSVLQPAHTRQTSSCRSTLQAPSPVRG